MASSLMARVWKKDGLKIVLKGPGLKRSGKKFSFAQPFARIGRFPYLDLPIDDPEVSRWHVYLQRFPEGVFFVDLGSRLGLVHRGAACRDGWLDARDPLEIGDYSLMVAETGGGGGGDGGTSLPRENPLARIEADRDDLLPVTLTFLTRDGNSIDHRLKRRLTLVGRSKPSNVRIADPSIARAHLAFYRTQTEAWIVNLAAASAFHEGQPLTSARLADEDAFLVGDLTIVARVGSRAGERTGVALDARPSPPARAPGDSGALLLDALEPTELEEGLAPENTWDSDQAVATTGSVGAAGPEVGGSDGAANDAASGFVVESAGLDARGASEYFAEPRIVIGPPDIHLARFETDPSGIDPAPEPRPEPIRVFSPDPSDSPPLETNGHAFAPENRATGDEALQRESTRLIEENLRLLEQQSANDRELTATRAKLDEVERLLGERDERIAALADSLRAVDGDRDQERAGRRQADEEIERRAGELKAALERLAQVEAETAGLKRALAEEASRSAATAARLAERDALVAKMRGNQFKAAALIRQRNRQLEQLRGELAERTQERDELATICREWKDAAQAGHDREKEMAEAARTGAAALADLQARLLARDQECLETQAKLALLASERENSATASAALRLAELERLFGEATRRGEQEHQRLVQELATSQAELGAMSREVANLTRALRESDSRLADGPGPEAVSTPLEPTPAATERVAPAIPHLSAPPPEPSHAVGTPAVDERALAEPAVGAPAAGEPAASDGAGALDPQVGAKGGAGEAGPDASSRPSPSKVAATLLDRAEGINQARQSLINVGWIALSLVSLITLAFGLFWIMLP